MQPSKRALLVDSDPDSRKRIAELLASRRFDCREAETASAGLAQARRECPDVILVDAQLPDLSGLGLCRMIRETPSLARAPLILLSTQASEIDRVLAFEAGADDFLSKPFYPAELAARVEALLRGFAAWQPAARACRAGRVTIDSQSARAEVNGERMNLTPTEFQMLALLVREGGRVVRRRTLLEAIWGESAPHSDRTVDAHIKSIRRKLGPARACLETVRGVGYRFSDPAVE